MMSGRFGLYLSYER